MKLLGIIITLAGFVIIVLNLLFKNSIAKVIPFGNPLWITIIGLVAVIAGAFLIKTETTKYTQAHEEVPIYHGNKIVGYRKEKK